MKRSVVLLSPLFGAALVLGLAATSAAADVSHRPAATERSVIRPVHGNGQPVHGYRVTYEYVEDFECYGPSHVSVSNGIQDCGFTATSSDACWPSTDHTVLCLTDPLRKELTRYPYVGSLPAAPRPKHPDPMTLRLGDKQTCRVRVGGAWDNLTHYPNWYGTYGCTKSYIYSPSGSGIRRASRHWTTYVFFGPDSYKHKRFVATAAFVGTAN